MDYCTWIPESGGHNPRIREWGWHESWLQTADDVYWDLMAHYSEISEKARKAFDPLSDWELYLKGEKSSETGPGNWSLNNMGEKGDLSWYAIMLKYDGRTLHRPSRTHMKGRLLTHTTGLYAANQIMKRGYLRPRICYSATRVISVREPVQVTFIFDREIMQRTYSIKSYQEASHEQEMRSHEINSIQMAIACVPTVTQIFKGIQGRGQGTVAIGEETIAQWSDRYEREQRLWTPEEEKAIRSIATTISQ